MFGGAYRAPRQFQPRWATKGLGTVTADDVFPMYTQFRAVFRAVVPAGQTPPRGSLPGEAELQEHVVAAVSSTTTSITVEITDRWKILIPMSYRTIGGRVRSIYSRWLTGNVDITGLYGAVPMGAEGTPPRDISTGAASDLARRVVDNLEAMGSRYDHALVQSFQRAAGISADGVYGSQTRSALLRYVSSAPSVDSVRTPGGGGGGGGGGGAQPDTGTPGGQPAASSGAGPWIAGLVALALVGGFAYVATR